MLDSPITQEEIGWLDPIMTKVTMPCCQKGRQLEAEVVQAFRSSFHITKKYKDKWTPSLEVAHDKAQELREHIESHATPIRLGGPGDRRLLNSQK